MSLSEELVIWMSRMAVKAPMMAAIIASQSRTEALSATGAGAVEAAADMGGSDQRQWRPLLPPGRQRRRQERDTPRVGAGACLGVQCRSARPTRVGVPFSG